MYGICRLLPNGKNPAGNILRKSHCLYCRVLFWRQLIVEHGFSTRLQAVAQQGLQQICLVDVFLGIDKEEEFLILSQSRKKEIEHLSTFSLFRNKIKDIALLDSMGKLSVQEDFACGYDLPFNEHPRVLCYGCFGFENIGLYKIVLPALHSAGKAQQTNKTFLI